jgi:hypothetical protein
MEQWSTETVVLPKVEVESKPPKKGRHSATSSIALPGHTGWDFGSEQDSEAETYVPLLSRLLTIVPIRATLPLEPNKAPSELVLAVPLVPEMRMSMPMTNVENRDRKLVKIPPTPTTPLVSRTMANRILFPVLTLLQNSPRRGDEWP